MKKKLRNHAEDVGNEKAQVGLCFSLFQAIWFCNGKLHGSERRNPVSTCAAPMPIPRVAARRIEVRTIAMWFVRVQVLPTCSHQNSSFHVFSSENLEKGYIYIY